MPPRPKYNECDFERRLRIGGVIQRWIGERFCDTRDECRAWARELRALGCPARAVTIPETPYGRGFGMAERYLIFVPAKLAPEQLEVLRKWHEAHPER